MCFDARGNDSHFCDQDTVRKPHNIHICQLVREQTQKNVKKIIKTRINVITDRLMQRLDLSNTPRQSSQAEKQSG